MKKEQFDSRSGMIVYFLRGSKRYFGFALFFACMTSLLELLNPKIIGYTVDSVIDQQGSRLPAVVNALVEKAGGAAYFRTHLGVIALAVVCVALLAALCRFLFQLNNAKGAETLVERMRNSLFEHIIRLPSQWHSENHTGDIIQRCTSDVEQVKMFVAEMLTALFRITLLITLAVYFMVSIHPRLAMASCAFFVVIITYSIIFHRMIGSSFRKADEEEGRLSSIAQENLTGVRVVRAFGREAYERQRFEKQNNIYTDHWIYLMKLLGAFWTSGDLISWLQILTVLCYGSWLCVHGQLTAGDFIAFIAYNSMLTWPVRLLGRVIASLSRANIAIDRLRYIMNAETEQETGELTPDMHGDICFDHVSYQYENSSAGILHDVTFTVKAGSTVGILGATGSGKSTLMNLLDRLYVLPEDGGRITVGGVDINDIKSDWLRGNIGMVLQEPYLFSRTLSENIGIAGHVSDMKQIREAARIASLDESVSHFTEGYNTYVGERGVTLSGGQKQRTAIAQMLVRKPPIMVFDDSLSAVDAETDAKIRNALKKNVSGSTVILIAHRITTLMSADHIIVLDKGRIAEEGTHDELIEKNGIYRKIYDLQVSQGELGEAAI
ncbi:MAG: ABC transporter ATP-binding protein/permease [Solobacterium sp.]|nr:ABC transporter ATP-binding protein/permease [Solobacterium sp.]